MLTGEDSIANFEQSSCCGQWYYLKCLDQENFKKDRDERWIFNTLNYMFLTVSYLGCSVFVQA